MIKNIVLDIGNVVLSFCWQKHVESFGFPEEIRRKVSRAVFEDADWNEVDRGVLTKEQIIDLFIENDPSVEKEIRLVMENIGGTIEKLPYTDEIVPRLHALGYRVYVLSNYGSFTQRDCGEKMNFLKQADGDILSYRYQVIKPDERIYRILLDTYGLKAEECLFFDDREDNVEGARKCGLFAEVFTGYEEMFRVIEEYRRRQA